VGIWVEFFASAAPDTARKHAPGQGGAERIQWRFIDHSSRGGIPDGLTPQAQVFLGVLVLIVNVALYWWVWRRARGGA
jgi:hypothetical protein